MAIGQRAGALMLTLVGTKRGENYALLSKVVKIELPRLGTSS